jgi:hypothetical protein
MSVKNITMTLDAAHPSLGLDVGHVVSFRDGLPTVQDGVGFYISQLAFLESTIYESKYATITYQNMVPINTSVPDTEDQWGYISYDAVTMGKFIGASASDLPTVAVNANKTMVPLGYAGISAEYSIDDLRKTQKFKMPIDTIQIKTAFRGSQEHMQRVAYFGDSDRGMNGLFNNPNLALDNSTLNWTTGTGQERVNDMNSMLVALWVNSAQTHLANTFAIDPVRYASLSSRRMDNGTDTTELEFFIKNNLYTSLTKLPLDVVPLMQLSAAELTKNGVSNGGKDRMMAYERNDENLSMVVSIPFRPLAPQLDGLKIKVPCEYKMSGVEFRFPFSAVYRDHS